MRRHEDRSLARSAVVAPLVALALLSCGGTTAPVVPPWADRLPASVPYGGALQLRTGEAWAAERASEQASGEVAEPPLELRVPWENSRARQGWGQWHLWARPASDHVAVSAIIDAPAERPRWASCDGLRLRADGAPIEREAGPDAEYVGRAMPGGASYEAVRIHFGVHELRMIGQARDVRGTICGDPIVLSPALRASVRAFVEWFDHLAAPPRFEERLWFRDVGAEPRLPGEALDDPEPASA